VTAVTGLSTTGSNVFRSRVYPLGTNKLPALSIYTDSEVVEYNRLDRVRYIDCTVDIVIEVYGKGGYVELDCCVTICDSTEGMRGVSLDDADNWIGR
jgi:hypothetical protein